MPTASTVQRAGCLSASSPSILSPTASSLTRVTVRFSVLSSEEVALRVPVLFSEKVASAGALMVPVALRVPVLPDMQDPPSYASQLVSQLERSQPEKKLCGQASRQR